MAGCSENASSDKDKESLENKSGKSRAEKEVLVELAELNHGLIESILERSASLEAEAQVQVMTRTSNPALELFVEEGDKVTKGQVLLRLENDKQRTDYNQAKGRLDKAQIEFKRQENLFKENLISEQVYLNAKFDYDQLVLTFETAKRQLDYTEVRAPIKGTITSRLVKVGDQVGTGMHVFDIIDFNSIVAVIHVPEQYLEQLGPEKEARLISATLKDEEGNDSVFDGYVKRISPIVEARAGTIKVTVGVKKLGKLRPGMWVDVELVLETKEDALLIPKKAIVYDNDQIFAFKLHTDTNGVKRVKRQLILAENTDKVHIEPKLGFELGEKIVVAGQSGLKENSRIREEGDPDPKKIESTTSSSNKDKSNSPSTKESPVKSGK